MRKTLPVVKGNFDFRRHLSQSFPCVTALRLAMLYPIAPFAIQAQAIQDQEELFVIRAVFRTQDTFRCHFDAEIELNVNLADTKAVVRSTSINELMMLR